MDQLLIKHERAAVQCRVILPTSRFHCVIVSNDNSRSMTLRPAVTSSAGARRCPSNCCRFRSFYR